MSTISLNVPLLDMTPQNAIIEEELLANWRSLIRSGRFILGPEVQSFEEKIAAYCEVPHAVGVSSGTDALLAALMVLDLQPGDRVITTSFSFFATAGAIVRLGGVPIFVDIDPKTFNLDPRTLCDTWQALSPEERANVRAVMPVHLFGQCADMRPIMSFAEEHGLVIVEDSAQALGSEYSHTTSQNSVGVSKAGAMGIIGCFSFFPSKNLGGAGDGGMVITSDDTLAEHLRTIRVHGAKPKYYHEIVGGNFRLDTIQAAMLLLKLKHLDRWHHERRKNAAKYNALFKSSQLEDSVTTPSSVFESENIDLPHIYNQYVIRARERDSLQAHLRERGIGTAIYYPFPLHQLPCFSYLGYLANSLPESERAARETLALPVYPGLQPEQQEYVVDCITSFYRGAS